MSDLEKKEERSEKLFEALGNVDPELLLRSEKTKTAKIVGIWKYTGMLAACVAFLLVGGISIYVMQISGGEMSDTQTANSAAASGGSHQSFSGDGTAAKQEAAEEAPNSTGIAGSESDSYKDWNGGEYTADAESDSAEAETSGSCAGNMLSLQGNVEIENSSESAVFYTLEELKESCDESKFTGYLPEKTPDGYAFDQGYVWKGDADISTDDFIILFFEGGQETVAYCLMDVENAGDYSENGTIPLKGEELTLEMLEEELAAIKKAEMQGEYGRRLGILFEDGVLAIFAGIEDPQTVIDLLMVK